MSLNDELIHIVDNKAAPSAYAKTVLEFKDLATEELAFIYFMEDHKSPFSVYGREQRIIEVKNSIFGEKKKWKPSAKVLGGCKKYEKLIETSAVRLLKAARESIVKLEKYFRNIDLHLMDDHGKPIFHAKDLIANLANMGKVVDGLTRLEDIVKKEEQASNTNRGGIEVNKYSM
jgi:phosphatidylinositol kinase/protein kinase (PI-3  family)